MLFGKDIVEYELAIKNDIGVVFDELHVPETLNATQLDKFMKKVFKTWDSNYYFERLTQFKVPKRKKGKRVVSRNEYEAIDSVSIVPSSKIINFR